jgi:hypothetical protein
MPTVRKSLTVATRPTRPITPHLIHFERICSDIIPRFNVDINQQQSGAELILFSGKIWTGAGAAAPLLI